MLASMVKGCPDCDRLWGELHDAITNHLRLLGKYQIAAMIAGYEQLHELELLCKLAEQKRANARATVFAHRDSHGAQGQPKLQS
jgi:hypothetical protein